MKRTGITLLLLLPVLAWAQLGGRPVLVSNTTYGVMYPTNFWPSNAMAMSNALVGIGFVTGGAAATNGLATTNYVNTQVQGATNSFSGANLAVDSVNSNKLDAATRALLGGGGADLSFTNSVLFNENNEWGLFAVAFDNGVEWPTYAQSEQQGHTIFSRDAVNWFGGSGGPSIVNTNKAIRDACAFKVADTYYFSATTNINASNSVAFSLWSSPNLSAWSVATNIAPTLAGETFDPTNTAVFGPFAAVVGADVWMTVGVCTNWNAATMANRAQNGPTTNSYFFYTRIASCPTNTFPHGWTAWSNLNFSGFSAAGISTNIIDLTPFYDPVSDKVFAFFKDEYAWEVLLGVWASKSPGSAFAPYNPVGATWNGNVLGAYRQGMEAPWMIRKANGRYAIAVNKFVDGGSGQSRRYYIFETFSTNLLEQACWYSGGNLAPRIANFSKEFQNFKPLVLTSAKDVRLAVDSATAGNVLSGSLNIPGRFYSEQVYSASASGLKEASNGLAITTNDYARIVFGAPSYPAGGIWASTNGTLRFVSSSVTQSDSSSPGFTSYAYEVFSISNRALRLAANTIISGNGSGLTNLNGSVLLTSSGANTFTNGTITLNTNGFGGGGSATVNSVTYPISLYSALLVGPSVNTLASGIEVAGPRYTSTYQWAAFPLMSFSGYTTNIIKATFVTTNSSTNSFDFIVRYFTNGTAVDLTAYPNLVSRSVTNTTGAVTNTFVVRATNTTGSAWSFDAANLKLGSAATWVGGSAWLIGLEQTLMK